MLRVKLYVDTRAGSNGGVIEREKRGRKRKWVDSWKFGNYVFERVLVARSEETL